MGEIIKIGNTVKLRGTYSDSAVYYRDNQVTTYGCLFVCKADSVTGKSPISIDEETGEASLANTDVWNCLINAVQFHNYSLHDHPQAVSDHNRAVIDHNLASADHEYFDNDDPDSPGVKQLWGDEDNGYKKQMDERIERFEDVVYMGTPVAAHIASIDDTIPARLATAELKLATIPKHAFMTEAEYEALAEIDPNTLYFLYEE